MKKNKPTILLDFDDTFITSSQIVIDILNEKNGTNKTIDDLEDWNYRSIDPTLTAKEVSKIYESEEFWKKVCSGLYFNEGALEFLIDKSKNFSFAFCSIGSKKNLEEKQKFLNTVSILVDDDIEFIGIEYEDSRVGSPLNKSCIDFSNCYLAIDDNTNALSSINAPTKILLKNNREKTWNHTPINEENIYVVNTFKEISEMCDFDLTLWR